MSLDDFSFGANMDELRPPAPTRMPGMGIDVSANRSDEEPHRLFRLWRVVGRMEIKHPELRGRVMGLHDHKGNLTVTWASQPTEEERRSMFGMWEWEYEMIVHHEWPGWRLEDGDDAPQPW